MTSIKAECPKCHQDISVNKDSTLRTHHVDGVPCPGGNPPKSTGASIDEKARRYLSEGRVKVRTVHGTSAVVFVQGSRVHPYEVVYASGAWRCPCDAQVWRCSHVAAAQLIIDVHSMRASMQDEIDALLGA